MLAVKINCVILCLELIFINSFHLVLSNNYVTVVTITVCVR